MPGPHRSLVASRLRSPARDLEVVRMGFGLVLGGGGAMGDAWEIAVLAALEESGASVRGADVVVGTSAGSIVGAQVFGGRSFDEMLAEMEVTEAPAEMGDSPISTDGGDNAI